MEVISSIIVFKQTRLVTSGNDFAQFLKVLFTQNVDKRAEVMKAEIVLFNISSLLLQ